MPENNQFDAIVVGSGISGGWAAKELCEKGLKTLLLERGKPVQHVTGYTTASKNPWQFPHGGMLSPGEKEKHHVQIRHYSIREDNKHFYVNDKENPYTEVQRYDWVRADVLGGRSLLWARMSFRWNDLDFEANSKDGHGVDWPIRYLDLSPWYEYVEKFVGISGKAEELPILPDSVFQAPMEMNCAEKLFKQKVEQKFRDRHVIMGRAANLTEQLPGRGKCQYRNLCHRGCPYGAYFSTLSSTLPAAKQTGNLTVKTNALVNQVIYDDKLQRATGVEVIDTTNGTTTVYNANVIFLNAATLGTTFILLNSISSRFPNGLGNDHDIVGRYLMDHHKSGNVSGRMEGLEDSYYYGRRPIGIFVPRFRNVQDKSHNFLRGYNLQGGASRGRSAGDAAIGAELKQSLTEAGPWRMGLTGFGECLPYAQNRVTLNKDVKDKYGRNTLSIDCSFKENEKNMRKDALESMQEMMEAAGLKDIKAEGSMSFPGNANHEMGTARMGRDPKTSVLNKWNQMHEVKNVFITDGSCMPSIASVNPSLTFMALTARAVDYAVREMRKNNI